MPHSFEKQHLAFEKAHELSKYAGGLTWYVVYNMEHGVYYVTDEQPTEAWERLHAVYHNGVRTVVPVSMGGDHCKKPVCLKSGDICFILGKRVRIEAVDYVPDQYGAVHVNLSYIILINENGQTN